RHQHGHEIRGRHRGCRMARSSSGAAPNRIHTQLLGEGTPEVLVSHRLFVVWGSFGRLPRTIYSNRYRNSYSDGYWNSYSYSYGYSYSYSNSYGNSYSNGNRNSYGHSDRYGYSH